MARDLRLLTAGIERPDERHIPADRRTGPYLALRVASEDLKARPVHSIRLTEDEAIRLLAQLAGALDTMRRNR